MRISVIRVILLCYSQEDESEVIDELDKLLDDLEPSIVQELPTVPTDKVEEDHNIEDQLPDVPTTVKKALNLISPSSLNIKTIKYFQEPKGKAKTKTPVAVAAS